MGFGSLVHAQNGFTKLTYH